MKLPKHGSPRDRGAADAYYGRDINPHYWPEGTCRGQRISQADMTDEQVDEYMKGYNGETARKDWGR